jgi:hypothetical protein
VDGPVADEDKRQHREKPDDINESPALEIFRGIPAHRRADEMKLEFLRSMSRQLPAP